MNARILTALSSLVLMMFALSACGGGGSGSAASPVQNLARDATVTVSFGSGNAGAKSFRISGSTNYIQLYVTQWQAGDLNTLSVVNQDTSHTLTPANPSATLTLYSTYTRICASQYSSTPASSSPPLEASCSFGILNSGNNSVTLTMLSGQWTLSSAYNGFGSFVLSYPSNITTATTGSVSYGVFDGNTGSFTTSHLPAQSINNWGSQFQLQLMDGSGNIVTGLVNENAFASTFFNSGDNGPSLAGVTKSISAAGTTQVAIGGFGRGVDSDGWIRETKNVIVYPLTSTTPVITYPSSALKVEDNNGNIVTGTVLAGCQLQVAGGSSLQGCGITDIKDNYGNETGSSDIQKGTSGNFNYKVTSTAAVAGADICYTNNAGASRDSSGNLICYDYDYFTTPSGTACPANGSYNNSRCEYTLSSTCTNNIHSGNQNTGNANVYNATSQSCTSTGVGYYLKLNSTALTFTAD